MFLVLIQGNAIARYSYRNQLRVDVLDWNDPAATKEFIEEYRRVG